MYILSTNGIVLLALGLNHDGIGRDQRGYPKDFDYASWEVP